VSSSRGSRSGRRSTDSAGIRREAARRARAATADQGRGTPRRRVDPRDAQLAPQHRGPVRAYVRDVVDSRRRLVGLFLPALGAVVLSLASPSSDLQRYFLLGSGAALAVAVADAVVLGASITRSARARFPDEPVPAPATGWYAFVRAHRSRSVRRPPPRVAPGGVPVSRMR